MAQDATSFSQLLNEFLQEIRTLFSQEVALAKAELRQGASRLMSDVVLLVVGGVILLASIFVFVAAAVLGLAEVVEPWLSALIVGAVIAFIGFILLRVGMSKLKKQNFMPDETIRSLKEDSAWAKEQMR